MTPKTTDLTSRQRELLAGFAFDPQDMRATFGGPQIQDWQEVKKLFVTFGAKWRPSTTKRLGFFQFPDETVYGRFQAAMQQGQYVDPRANDFFPTPAWLADEMVQKADLDPGDLVLEPSAGRGSIVTAILNAHGSEVEVHCCELLPENQAFLNNLDMTVVGSDFLEFTRMGPAYDAVIMNPPFGSDGGVVHVEHAMRCVKAFRNGGRIVAVMSAGVLTHQDRRTKAFRAVIQDAGGEFEPNPDGTFESSGTSVRTVTMTVPRR